MSGPEIIVKEMLPNLFPYLAAALVNSVSAAILASIGLEALGLGPIESPTLGMTIYWVLFNAALINGWWWWWTPPIVIIVILFVGLFADLASASTRSRTRACARPSNVRARRNDDDLIDRSRPGSHPALPEATLTPVRSSAALSEPKRRRAPDVGAPEVGQRCATR